MKEVQQQKEEDITKLQAILVQQADIASQRVKAVEEKYQTLRRINIALEVSMTLLHASLTITRNIVVNFLKLLPVICESASDTTTVPYKYMNITYFEQCWFHFRLEGWDEGCSLQP